MYLLISQIEMVCWNELLLVGVFNLDPVYSHIEVASIVDMFM